MLGGRDDEEGVAAGQGLEAVRPIRDEIRRRVEALIDSLDG